MINTRFTTYFHPQLRIRPKVGLILATCLATLLFAVYIITPTTRAMDALTLICQDTPIIDCHEKTFQDAEQIRNILADHYGQPYLIIYNSKNPDKFLFNHGDIVLDTWKIKETRGWAPGMTTNFLIVHNRNTNTYRVIPRFSTQH